MDFEKLSDRLKGFIQSAQTLAVREGNPQITPEHLLKVLLDDPEGLASGLINRAGGNAKQALEKTEGALAKLPKVSGSGATQPHMAAALARVLDQAEQMATKAGDSFVTVERAPGAHHEQGGRCLAHLADTGDRTSAPYRRSP
jgi:ATP-dependent Clp protease ATP-binding subunit ClpB